MKSDKIATMSKRSPRWPIAARRFFVLALFPLALLACNDDHNMVLDRPDSANTARVETDSQNLDGSMPFDNLEDANSKTPSKDSQTSTDSFVDQGETNISKTDGATNDQPMMDANISDGSVTGMEPRHDDPLDLNHGALFRCNGEINPSIPPRLWRLNARQFDRLMTAILRDNYKTTLRVSNPYEGLHSGQLFSNPANGFGMDNPTFELLAQTAQSAAQYLTSAQSNMSLPACAYEQSPQNAEECWTETMMYISSIAWRRPPRDEEIDDYLAVIRGSGDRLSHREKIQLLIQAVILSPMTNFRTEIGEVDASQPNLRRLTSHEIASAINYAVRDEPPSEALRAAAQDGRLESLEDIRRELNSLLLAGHSQRGITRLYRELFGYKAAENVFKDMRLHPGVDQGSLVRETNYTIDRILDEGGDILVKLLTSRTYVGDVPLSCPSCADSEELGIPGDVEELDANRAGVLTHPAWLIAFSRNDSTDPVGRGRFIRERLLCTKIPSAPPGVILQLPSDDEELTMRERLNEHVQPECAGCHDLMDPLGLPFEMYDHLGAFQLMERPDIDPSGRLTGSGNQDGPVTDAVDLANRLAQSERVEQCYVRTAFRYWMGQDERLEDACLLTSAYITLVDGDGELEPFLSHLLTSATFLYRKPSDEVEEVDP